MVTFNPDSSLLTVNIETTTYHPGLEADTCTISSLQLDSRTRLADLNNIVGAHETFDKHYDFEIIIPQHPEIIVSQGESTYEPTASHGLQINLDQPLSEYFKQYRSHHHLTKANNVNGLKASVASFQRTPHLGTSSSIKIGPAQLTFHRTLRVPDGNNSNNLPPSLGSFPFTPASDYAENLSEAMKSRGGILMPIMQREAMWIGFSGSGDCALKISIGGINAITGSPRDKGPPAGVNQDYVALPQQPWLDGICTEPGVVRQFVAMPLGQGYTVEEQVTGHAELGGIQIDVYPSLNSAVTFVLSSAGNLQNSGLDISMSSRQLQIDSGKSIGMRTELPLCDTLAEYTKRITATIAVKARCGVAPIRVTVKTASGDTHSIPVTSKTTVNELKNLVPNGNWASMIVNYQGQALSTQATLGELEIPTGAVLIFQQPLLTSWRTMSRSTLTASAPPAPSVRRGGASMGMAAGGKIDQKIYPDTKPVSLYDEECGERLWIHTLSSEGWEDITGLVPPKSPVNKETYASYNYPWFKLYDEQHSTLQPTGAFDSVKSINALDNSAATELTPGGVELLDPNSPPPCAKHRGVTSSCVFRPCSHTACNECIEKASKTTKCPVCDAAVDTFVGFKKPIKVTDGGGDWKYVETLIEDQQVDAKVITLMLEEDRVVYLHGSGRRVM